MNKFTIEIIQTAVSFLPFLIAFTLMFSRGLGKYWVLPSAAFLANSAYRIYILYESAGSEVFIGDMQELLIEFAPSLIFLLLFFAMLSIQISLLRERQKTEQAAVKLLNAPEKKIPSGEAEESEDIHLDKKKILNHGETVNKHPTAKLDIPAEKKTDVTIPQDPQAREKMHAEIAQLKTDLTELLELARFNGALKKPRKKRKVPKRRKKTKK